MWEPLQLMVRAQQIVQQTHSLRMVPANWMIAELVWILQLGVHAS
jgi:hypothetical protein